jgi:hypothetical protein
MASEQSLEQLEQQLDDRYKQVAEEIKALPKEERAQKWREEVKKLDDEYRLTFADLELPKELEDRLVEADSEFQFIRALLSAMAHKFEEEIDADYAVERQRKLEMDRNSAAASGGVGFVGILTILALETHSTQLDVAFYLFCLVTPMLVARAALYESWLRSDEKPIRRLKSLVVSILESLGLGVGILALIGHYSWIASAVMAVGGMAAWFITLYPGLKRAKKNVASSDKQLSQDGKP